MPQYTHQFRTAYLFTRCPTRQFTAIDHPWVQGQLSLPKHAPMPSHILRLLAAMTWPPFLGFAPLPSFSVVKMISPPLCSTGTEDHTLNKPERTLSPQRPAYHQEQLATYGPSLQQSNFNVHESPAMGLLGPASNHAAACVDVPGTHSALGSTASLHSLSHSTSSVQPKPTVLQESHRYPRAEATLLSMAPSSACTEGGHASAGAPVLAGGRPGSGNGPTCAGTLEQSEHATLSEHPSMRSPFVGRPGPASAAFTPITAAPEPKHSTPSSFVQNLKLSEAKQVSAGVLQLLLCTMSAGPVVYKRLSGTPGKVYAWQPTVLA